MRDKAKTILIVEDEELLSKMLEKILNKLGYNVLKAVNGKEGLDVFREKYLEIDGVILDMNMPVMSGKTAFLEMKKIDRDIKAILSTGSGTNEDTDIILNLGVKELLSKPYHLSELELKLKSVIN